MDNRQKQDLDRYITGNYGEDQFSATEDINSQMLTSLEEVLAFEEDFMVHKGQSWPEIIARVRAAVKKAKE